MATLTSANTDQEVWDAYDDNASYDTDNSTSKAAAFVEACRILLRRRPTSISSDGVSTAFNDRAIEAELSRAQKWLAINRSGGRAKYRSFRDLRT